ncbi:hypothetical protein TNCV_1190211 [Trichonephila clavipes]|nr:hypothetical protein TNCV_1190211 [Trichonephila clavipes]
MFKVHEVRVFSGTRLETHGMPTTSLRILSLGRQGNIMFVNIDYEGPVDDEEMIPTTRGISQPHWSLPPKATSTSTNQADNTSDITNQDIEWKTTYAVTVSSVLKQSKTAKVV